MGKLLTTKEAAKKLRVSGRTIMRYIYAKKIRAIKMGQWRIRQSDIDAFLRKNSNK